MAERDYRKEAEKLVSTCELLEEEYVKAFNRRELRKCELIARRLDKIDPDFKLQSDATLSSIHKESIKQFLQERQKDISQHEHFVRIAVRLLKQGKYKPLR